MASPRALACSYPGINQGVANAIYLMRSYSTNSVGDANETMAVYFGDCGLVICLRSRAAYAEWHYSLLSCPLC